MPRAEIQVLRVQWTPQGYDGVALSFPPCSVEVNYTIDPAQGALVVGQDGLNVLDRSTLASGLPSEKVIVIQNPEMPAVAVEGTVRILRWNNILTGLAAEVEVLLMRRYEPLVPPRQGWARPMYGFRALARIVGQAKCVEDLATYTKDASTHTLGWKPGQQDEASSGPKAFEGPLSPLVIVEKSEGVSVEVPQGAVYRMWREIGRVTAKV
jgi:hypothetical protein